MLAPDAHLRRADPVMARLIDDFGGPLPEEPDFRGRPADEYGALVRGITGQQLSVKAAAAIWARFLERYGGTTPTPEQILADDPEELRVGGGFSHAKVRYLRSLAERIVRRRARPRPPARAPRRARSSASSPRSRGSASGPRTCS